MESKTRTVPNPPSVWVETNRQKLRTSVAVSDKVYSVIFGSRPPKRRRAPVLVGLGEENHVQQAASWVASFRW